eukprot:3339222-Prymnesium_polylepis.1
MEEYPQNLDVQCAGIKDLCSLCDGDDPSCRIYQKAAPSAGVIEIIKTALEARAARPQPRCKSAPSPRDTQSRPRPQARSTDRTLEVNS